jgi:5'-3' exonuclease
LNKKGEIVKAKDELKEKIRTNIEGIKTAYQLVKICCDLDVEPDFSKQQVNFDALFETFEKLDFKQFINERNKWEESFCN